MTELQLLFIEVTSFCRSNNCRELAKQNKVKFRNVNNQNEMNILKQTRVHYVTDLSLYLNNYWLTKTLQDRS
jgi:hypothetical protein